MIHNDLKFDQFIGDEMINNGGCGLYALAVARYLNREYSVNDLQLAVCSYDNYKLKEIKHNNNIINNVPSHVVIVIDDWCIDAEHGVIEMSEFKEIWKERNRQVEMIDFDEEAMVEALNMSESWNTYFERSQYLSVFEEHFGIKLDDVLLEV